MVRPKILLRAERRDAATSIHSAQGSSSALHLYRHLASEQLLRRAQVSGQASGRKRLSNVDLGSRRAH
jgi:hypothetical protein